MHMHLHCICVLPICVFISLEVTVIAITQTQQALLQNVKNPWAPWRWKKTKKQAQAVMVQEEYKAKTCPAIDSEKNMSEPRCH